MRKYIKYYFTRNDLIGSKAISWGTRQKGQGKKEVPSHFAIEFFEMFVIESRFDSGVTIDYIQSFKDRNDTIVWFEDTTVTGAKAARAKLKKVLDAVYGKKYDWKAVLYFSWRILLWKFLGIDIPKENKAENRNRNFCTEIYEVISGKEMSMMSPNDLMLEMENMDTVKRGTE